MNSELINLNNIKKIKQDYLLLFDTKMKYGDYLFKPTTKEEYFEMTNSLIFNENIYFKGLLFIEFLSSDFMKAHLNYSKENKRFIEKQRLWREIRRRELIEEKRLVEFLIKEKFEIKFGSMYSETGVIYKLNDLIKDCLEKDVGFGFGDFVFIKGKIKIVVNNYYSPKVYISSEDQEKIINYKPLFIYDKEIYEKLKGE